MLVNIQTAPESFEYGLDPLQSPGKGYYIYVTEACNLRCSYCFVTDKQNDRHLTDEMAEKVLAYVLGDTEGRKSKYVHFFGGEPLIRAKMVDYLAGKIREWATENKCDLRLGITTNGTLLTEANCEMLKKHNIGVQLSLDGSEHGNDVHRQLMGGSQSSGNVGGSAKRSAGAFHLVKIENYIKYFGGNEPNCRMTVTPENMDYLPVSLKELVELHGFKSFSVIGAADSKWDKPDIYRYRDTMEKVFQWWVTEARSKGVVINTIKHHMDKMQERNLRTHLCQAGRSVIGITVDGEIFPCHDFSGKFSKDPEQRKELLLGHVEKGHTSNLQNYSDHTTHTPEGELKVWSGAGYDCKSCHARFTCDKGCPYVNRASTGDDWTVSPNYCEFNRIHVDLANRLLTQLDGEYTVYNKSQVRQLNERIEKLASQITAVPQNGKFPPKTFPPRKFNGRPDPSLSVGSTTGQVLTPESAPQTA